MLQANVQTLSGATGYLSKISKSRNTFGSDSNIACVCMFKENFIFLAWLSFFKREL